MPPISLRPAANAPNSAPMSKSAVCTLIRAMRSASCHRREESHLVAGTDARRGVGEILVHRATHRATIGEGARVARAALGEPRDEIADRTHVGRRRYALFRGTGPLAQPGEVENG